MVQSYGNSVYCLSEITEKIVERIIFVRAIDSADRFAQRINGDLQPDLRRESLVKE